jgi:hypothetical protein
MVECNPQDNVFTVACGCNIVHFALEQKIEGTFMAWDKYKKVIVTISVLINKNVLFCQRCRELK